MAAGCRRTGLAQARQSRVIVRLQFNPLRAGVFPKQVIWRLANWRVLLFTSSIVSGNERSPRDARRLAGSRWLASRFYFARGQVGSRRVSSTAAHEHLVHAGIDPGMEIGPRMTARVLAINLGERHCRAAPVRGQLCERRGSLGVLFVGRRLAESVEEGFEATAQWHAPARLVSPPPGSPAQQTWPHRKASLRHINRDGYAGVRQRTVSRQADVESAIDLHRVHG